LLDACFLGGFSKPCEDKIVYHEKVVYRDRILYQDKITYQEKLVFQEKIVYHEKLIYMPASRPPSPGSLIDSLCNVSFVSSLKS
jgi:hypothetical protein